jgi:hypothetical protein
VNLNKKLEVVVDFHLFDDLGRRTDLLNDILYGVVRGRGTKIHFCKQSSPEWRQNLSGFVKALGSDEPKV